MDKSRCHYRIGIQYVLSTLHTQMSHSSSLPLFSIIFNYKYSSTYLRNSNKQDTYHKQSARWQRYMGTYTINDTRIWLLLVLETRVIHGLAHFIRRNREYFICDISKGHTLMTRLHLPLRSRRFVGTKRPRPPPHITHHGISHRKRNGTTLKSLKAQRELNNENIMLASVYLHSSSWKGLCIRRSHK